VLSLILEGLKKARASRHDTQQKQQQQQQQQREHKRS
jgi:hypothetical protein